jgi:hypothetical protein
MELFYCYLFAVVVGMLYLVIKGWIENHAD